MSAETILKSEIQMSGTAAIAVYSERTDRQLVDLVLMGDETAFECIFDRHKRRIAVTAGRFFHDPADVDDVIQSAFTNAYFQLGAFRGLHEHSPASWLGRIATNICLNKLKQASAKLGALTSTLADNERESFAADTLILLWEK